MSISIYSGSSWVSPTSIYVYSGSAWVSAQSIYVYSGSQWVLEYSVAASPLSVGTPTMIIDPYINYTSGSSTVSDLSGGGNTLTLTGVGYDITTNAFVFDGRASGKNNGMDLSRSTTITSMPGSTASYVVWVKPASFANNMAVLELNRGNGANTNETVLYVGTSGKAYWWGYNTSSYIYNAETGFSSFDALTLNSWNQIVFTQIGTTTSITGSSTLTYDKRLIVIGNDWLSTSKTTFNGEIGAVGIYSNVLSSTDISNLNTALHARYP
jgi:hypothetical protein